MGALTVSKVRDFAGAQNHANLKFPVAASVKIFKGSALGESAGNVRAMVLADPFDGFSIEEVDNTAGAAGDKSCEAKQEGYVWEDVVGVTAHANRGAKVYMSSDNDFTLTVATNTEIGVIALYSGSGTRSLVHYKAQSIV